MIFVAGTDTGVGKTVICGLLARYFLDQGLRVATQKWVSTGGAGFPRDLEVHLALMGKRKSDFEGYLDSMSPYSFRLSASPHLAAERERRNIRPEKIKSALRCLCRDFDLVIVEGTGGLLVPLDRKTLIIDLVEKLKLPVLLVAANRLGAINHTLLALEALRSRKIEIMGVVFSQTRMERKLIREDNPRIVKELGKVKVLGEVPLVSDWAKARQAFRPIGDELRRALIRV